VCAISKVLRGRVRLIVLKLLKMYRTPPPGPGKGDLGATGGPSLSVDRDQLSPTGSSSSVFRDPAVLGVIKTPKPTSRTTTDRQADPGASTGAIPKTGKAKTKSSKANASMAPNTSRSGETYGSSYIIHTLKHGLVDLYGMDEVSHRQLLNSFKSQVTKMEKYYAKELRHKPVDPQELKDFCVSLHDQHERLKVISRSAEEQGLHEITRKGNIEGYLDRVCKLYDECQERFMVPDHDDSDGGVDFGSEGDDVEVVSQGGSYTKSSTVPSKAPLSVQQEPDQDTVTVGQSQVGAEARKVANQVSSVIASALTGQPAQVTSTRVHVKGPKNPKPQQTAAPQANVTVVRADLQPNLGGSQFVTQADVHQQPQTTQSGNSVAPQQPNPQVAQAPVQQVLQAPTNTPVAQDTGRVNIGRSYVPVLNLLEDRNRTNQLRQHPQYVSRRNAPPGISNPPPLVPPRIPQDPLGANIQNPGIAQGNPTPHRPVVPQPIGTQGRVAGPPPQGQLFSTFDPESFMRSTEARLSNLIQWHFQNAPGNQYDRDGHPSQSWRGDFGQASGGYHSTPKKHSSHRRRSKKPSESSNSSDSDDTSSSSSSNDSSSSESSSSSPSESGSSSDCDRRKKNSDCDRRKKKKKKHKKHCHEQPRAKLGQLPKFDGTKPELFRFFKSSYDYQVKQEKMSEQDKCVKLFDLLEGEARDLVVYYAEKFNRKSHSNMWRVLNERYGGTYRSQRRAFDFLDEMKPFRQFTHKEQHELLTKMRVVMDYIQKKQKSASKEKSFPTFITIRKLVPTKYMSEYTNWIYSNDRKDNIHSFFKWLGIKWRCTLELEEDKHPITPKAPQKVGKAKQFLTQNTENNSESQEYSDENEEESENSHSSNESQAEVFVAENRQGFKPKYKKKAQAFRKRPTANQQKVDQYSAPKCDFCKTERHLLTKCDKFIKADPLLKLNYMKKHRLCWHCLRSGHFINKCKVNVGMKCGVDGCERRHHPIVHPPVVKSKGLYIEDYLSEFFGIEENPSGGDSEPSPTQD